MEDEVANEVLETFLLGEMLVGKGVEFFSSAWSGARPTAQAKSLRVRQQMKRRGLARRWRLGAATSSIGGRLGRVMRSPCFKSPYVAEGAVAAGAVLTS